MNPSTLLMAEIATAINVGAVLVNLGIHIATTRQNRERIEKLEAAVIKMTEAMSAHAERIARVEETVEHFMNGKYVPKRDHDAGTKHEHGGKHGRLHEMD